METFFVLVEKDSQAIPWYYCGYNVKGLPCISSDINHAALYATSEGAELASKYVDDFKIEEHGF